MAPSLYDRGGQRKYLTPAELHEFLLAAETAEPEVRTFCCTLAYTGCRISEALQLTAGRVDLTDGVLVFESLKKRRRGIYRAVPVPPAFLDSLNRVHDLCALRNHPDGSECQLLWRWSRTTAWRRVCSVMDRACIEGRHATPRGLRHGLGVKAVISQVPLNLAQKWLGHSQLSTTSIYADAVGAEEKELAWRMWGENHAN